MPVRWLLAAARVLARSHDRQQCTFLWFEDKREVLFGGDDLQEQLVSAVESQPAGTAVIHALLAAFATAPQVFRPRDFLIERAAVIAANPPLQERELIKLSSLSDTLTTALMQRGSDTSTARLTVDVGITVLRLATERWIADDAADFTQLLSSGVADLLAVASDMAS